ncbi:MAG: acetylglutamate kinase [Terriglobales bacterium]
MLTVLKLGGSLLDPARDAAGGPWAALAAAVARRAAGGESLCLVHGGGAALTAFLAERRIPSRFHQGLRVTDAATLEAALMILAGTMNKRLTAALNAALEAAGTAARAVGLCGLDGGCVAAEVADPALGHVGRVTGGDPRLLPALLAAGFVPVLASLAAGPEGPLNVNADSFAAAVAAQLGASRLSFVTDVPGVLDAQGRVAPRLDVATLADWSANGQVRGGMLPKLAACRQALERGVGRVEVIGAAALLEESLAGPAAAGTQITLGSPA